MNQEIKAQWLQALRSGDYTQGVLRLRISAGDGQLRHCCLGVLCDVLDPEGWNVDEAGFHRHRKHFHRPHYDLECKAEIPDAAVHELIAINDHDPSQGFGPVIEYIEEKL